jgi:hypothetical protein
VLEILESIHRVVQIDDDALADIALDASPHQEQAGGGETCRDEKHREQESRAQSQSGQEGTWGVGAIGTDFGFLGEVQGNQRTNL